MPDFTPSGSPWYGKADQIESVVFAYADSVTTIGHYAFRNCRNLTEITLPDGLTTIEFGAFELCTSLKEITLPDSLTTIGLLAFAHCTDLTSITFTSDTPPRINGAQSMAVTVSRKSGSRPGRRLLTGRSCRKLALFLTAAVLN